MSIWVAVALLIPNPASTLAQWIPAQLVMVMPDDRRKHRAAAGAVGPESSGPVARVEGG